MNHQKCLSPYRSVSICQSQEQSANKSKIRTDYLQKSFLHLTRIERFPAFTRRRQHGHNVVVPEDAIGRVNLGNIAKQPFRVNLRQHQIILQIAKTIEKQLQHKNRLKIGGLFLYGWYLVYDRNRWLGQSLCTVPFQFQFEFDSVPVWFQIDFSK